MTSRDQIAKILTSLYAARQKNDLEGTLKDVADTCTFTLFGRGTGIPGLGAPIAGMPSVKAAVKALIETWHFADWRQVDLVIDGEKAVLHWSARVTNTQSKKSDVLDVVDFVTFRDGKIVDFRESTDTAMMVKLAAA
jgi:ketosteroid isomerase-like protein